MRRSIAIVRSSGMTVREAKFNGLSGGELSATPGEVCHPMADTDKFSAGVFLGLTDRMVPSCPRRACGRAGENRDRHSRSHRIRLMVGLIAGPARARTAQPWPGSLPHGDTVGPWPPEQDKSKGASTQAMVALHGRPGSVRRAVPPARTPRPAAPKLPRRCPGPPTCLQDSPGSRRRRNTGRGHRAGQRAVESQKRWPARSGRRAVMGDRRRGKSTGYVLGGISPIGQRRPCQRSWTSRPGPFHRVSCRWTQRSGPRTEAR